MLGDPTLSPRGGWGDSEGVEGGPSLLENVAFFVLSFVLFFSSIFYGGVGKQKKGEPH